VEQKVPRTEVCVSKFCPNLVKSVLVCFLVVIMLSVIAPKKGRSIFIFIFVSGWRSSTTQDRPPLPLPGVKTINLFSSSLEN
jgi:hypothetical protein